VKNLEDFSEAINELTENDMVIFDVDNTLILPRDLILRTENQGFLTKLSEEILINPEIVIPDKWDRNYLSSKTLLSAESMIVDPKIPSLIKKLQEKGVKTIALTAMQTGAHGLIESMEDWRIQQLKLHGIDFSATFPELDFLAFDEISRENSHPTFKSGVLSSGSHTKGEVLIAFLVHLNWKPKRIFMVDDKIEYLETVRFELETIDVDFRGFHYTAVEHLTSTLDENVARLQFQYLALYGEWLSDQQAKATLLDKQLHVKEKTIPLDDGTEIYCKILGSGSTIFCIHGGPGLDHTYFLPQMEQFASLHQLVLLDQRGSGKSSGEITSDSINIDQFVEDLENVRRSLGFKKIILLGHSWGSLIVCKYAIKYPERVTSIILMNPIPASQEGMQAFGEEVNGRKKTIAEALKKIEEDPEYIKNSPTLVTDWYRLMFSTYCCNPADAEKLTLHFTKSSITEDKKIQDIISKGLLSKAYDFYTEFSKITCSTLIIHGECDPIKMKDSEKLHQTIKGSNLVILPKAGHFPFVENPEALFTVIQKFLTPLSTS
jgi:proline iminopeptidase